MRNRFSIFALARNALSGQAGWARQWRSPDPKPAYDGALGHVTSSYFSANCGRSIALALLAGGRGCTGETLHATTPSGFAPVKVVSPVFL